LACRRTSLEPDLPRALLGRRQLAHLRQSAAISWRADGPLLAGRPAWTAPAAAANAVRLLRHAGHPVITIADEDGAAGVRRIRLLDRPAGELGRAHPARPTHAGAGGPAHVARTRRAAVRIALILAFAVNADLALAIIAR